MRTCVASQQPAQSSKLGAEHAAQLAARLKQLEETTLVTLKQRAQEAERHASEAEAKLQASQDELARSAKNEVSGLGMKRFAVVAS